MSVVHLFVPPISYPPSASLPTVYGTTVVKVSPSQSTDGHSSGGGTEENDLILEGNCPLYRMDREEGGEEGCLREGREGEREGG